MLLSYLSPTIFDHILKIKLEKIFAVETGRARFYSGTLLTFYLHIQQILQLKIQS